MKNNNIYLVVFDDSRKELIKEQVEYETEVGEFDSVTFIVSEYQCIVPYPKVGEPKMIAMFTLGQMKWIEQIEDLDGYKKKGFLQVTFKHKVETKLVITATIE